MSAAARRALDFRLLAISSGDLAGAAEDEERLLRWLDGLAAWVPTVAVQIREKRLDDRALHRLLQRARDRFPGTLLVNARADLAVAVRAAGVHLPASALPATAIRDRWGESLLIGLSVHSLAEVARAASVVDYVCLGPIFATPGKPNARPLGIAAIAAATGLGPPVVALGGIDRPARVKRALAAGATGIAGIRLFADPSRLGPVVRAAAREPRPTGSGPPGR
ncbi:MAG TPA: thiamine phosphate synthase [Thermoanaerobaculia bacterium]|nr:thiamine phosphate synthase [Thermoanaerobaculia bacterium]